MVVPENWPVYDTPYEVADPFGSYTEIIRSGADADARVLDTPAAAMIVDEDEWNEDHSRRTIHKISAIRPR